MRIGNVSLYVSAKEAAEHGCTHRAMLWGVIPGYAAEGPPFLWVSVSDLLNPIEDLISWVCMCAQELSGRQPQWGFRIGAELNGGHDDG